MAYGTVKSWAASFTKLLRQNEVVYSEDIPKGFEKYYKNIKGLKPIQQDLKSSDLNNNKDGKKLKERSIGGTRSEQKIKPASTQWTFAMLGGSRQPGMSLTALLHFSTVYYRMTYWLYRAIVTFTHGGITVGVTGVYLSFIFRQRNFELEFMLSVVGGILHLVSGAIVLVLLHSDAQDNLAIEVGIFGLLLGVLLFADAFMDLLDRRAIKMDTARLCNTVHYPGQRRYTTRTIVLSPERSADISK